MPGDKSDDPKLHFEAGMRDFVRFDKVRFINIGGSIQYGILYSIIYFIIGIIIHLIFPPFTKNITLLSLFGWILLQCIILVLATFYVRKFVESMPGIISFFPQYFNITELKAKGLLPYQIDEFHGDMTSSIVLIGTQYQLLQKIAYFTKEMAIKVIKTYKSI